MVDLLFEHWGGPDIQVFSDHWVSTGRPGMSAAADRLNGISKGLIAQALSQRSASDEGGRVASLMSTPPRAVAEGARAGAPASAPPGAAATESAAPESAAPESDDDLLSDQRGWGGARSAAAMPASSATEGGGGGSTADPNHPPADGASPRENNDWWNGLTPAQQQEVIAKHPEQIGNRDGIPYGARDQANRACLDTERARLVAERDKNIPYLDTPGGRGHNTEYDEYQAKIDSIDAIKRTLADDPNHEKQLVVLDTSNDRTEAAIARGNLDTADHIAVMTPGYTTTVDGSMAGMDRDSGALKSETERVLAANGQGDESVATVAWIGYQAPQESNVLFSRDSVAGTHAAKEGSDNLAGFGDGIRAVRGDEPHVTALGHSYGSTTTSYAMGKTDAFDDVAYFGTPGLDQGGTNGVGEGHAYVVEADGDKIADLGTFGRGDPSYSEDVVHLNSREHTQDGRHYSGSSGHSEYYKDGSMSQHNLATVVAGHGDQGVRGNNADTFDHSDATPDDQGATPDTERRRDKDDVLTGTSTAH